MKKSGIGRPRGKCGIHLNGSGIWRKIHRLKDAWFFTTLRLIMSSMIDGDSAVTDELILEFQIASEISRSRDNQYLRKEEERCRSGSTRSFTIRARDE